MPAKKTPPQDHGAEIDALFRLPPGEFTSARNALAARLKKEGRSAEAAEVKSLEKPSLSAWAVNQIYWQERKEFDDLLAATAGFRAAQTGRGDPRAALEARRQALARLARKALERLRAAGASPGPEMARRIANTLEALTTLSPSTDLVPGRLTRDVDPPGFEALAGLGARGARGAAAKAPRVLPFRPPAKPAASERCEATARRAEAERAAQAAARRAVQEAEQALRAARRASEQATRALAAARRKTEEARSLAQARAEEARQLERDAATAAAAVDEAQHRLERARARRTE